MATVQVPTNQTNSIRRHQGIITTTSNIRRLEAKKIVEEAMHQQVIIKLTWPKPSSKCLRINRLSGTTWESK